MRAATLVLVGLPLLALLPAPAGAVNWVVVSQEYNTFYDADSVFVDGATGYVVYNSATDLEGDGDFNYSAIAMDCDGQRYFALGWVTEGGGYEVDPGWDIDPSRVSTITGGNLATLVADALCPARANFRTDAIR